MDPPQAVLRPPANASAHDVKLLARLLPSRARKGARMSGFGSPSGARLCDGLMFGKKAHGPLHGAIMDHAGVSTDTRRQLAQTRLIIYFLTVVWFV